MKNKKIKVETIKCIDCGNEFLFSDDERIWYEEHELDIPKRCNSCLVIKKKKYNLHGDFWNTYTSGSAGIDC